MKHSIKMVVCDLDRTLLHTDGTISEYSLSVLNHLRKAGIKVVYATGRGDRSAKSVVPCTYFDGKITQGGAIVTAYENMISKYAISYDTARPLLIAFDKFGIKTMPEDSKFYYCPASTKDFIVNSGWTKSINIQSADFFTHNIDAEKISVFLTSTNEAEFVKQHLPEELYLTVARDGHGTIMRKEATKTMGVEKLAAFWGIDQAEIVSFGDDAIDIDLLRYSGIGVAVTNATKEVKAAADYICESNDEDGVAKWLAKHIL